MLSCLPLLSFLERAISTPHPTGLAKWPVVTAVIWKGAWAADESLVVLGLGWAAIYLSGGTPPNRPRQGWGGGGGDWALLCDWKFRLTISAEGLLNRSLLLALQAAVLPCFCLYRVLRQRPSVGGIYEACQTKEEEKLRKKTIQEENGKQK